MVRSLPSMPVAKPLGAFSKDARIVDPRGLAVNQEAGLIFLIAAPTGFWRLTSTGGLFATLDRSRG